MIKCQQRDERQRAVIRTAGEYELTIASWFLAAASLH
jgi:hypothetical protein